MAINLDLSTVPRRAWIIISWGIFLVLVSWAIRGTISVDVAENAPEGELVEEEPMIIEDEHGFHMEQRPAPGTIIRSTEEGIEIRKGGAPSD